MKPSEIGNNYRACHQVSSSYKMLVNIITVQAFLFCTWCKWASSPAHGHCWSGCTWVDKLWHSLPPKLPRLDNIKSFPNFSLRSLGTQSESSHSHFRRISSWASFGGIEYDSLIPCDTLVWILQHVFSLVHTFWILSKGSNDLLVGGLGNPMRVREPWKKILCQGDQHEHGEHKQRRDFRWGRKAPNHKLARLSFPCAETSILETSLKRSFSSPPSVGKPKSQNIVIL